MENNDTKVQLNNNNGKKQLFTYSQKIAKSRWRFLLHFISIAAFIVVQAYGYFYYLNIKHIEKAVLSPIVLVTISLAIYFFWVAIDAYRKRKEKFPSIKYIEIPPLDTSLSTFFFSLLLTCYLAGYTILDINKFIKQDDQITCEIIKLKDRDGSDSKSRLIKGSFSFTKPSEPGQTWPFTGMVDNSSNILYGSATINTGICFFDQYIVQVEHKLPINFTNATENITDVHARLHSIKNQRFLMWLFVESLIFSWLMTVSLRLWLINIYQANRVDVPSTLSHQENNPAYVEIINPHGDRRLATFMENIMQDPGELYLKNMAYPPDIFATEIMESEKNLPISFFNVWCYQSEMLNSNIISNDWSNVESLEWRKYMLFALKIAYETAKKNAGRNEGPNYSFYYTNDAEIPEKLKHPLGARILIFGRHAEQSLAFKTIIKFHKIANIPLFILPLEKVEKHEFKKSNAFTDDFDSILKTSSVIVRDKLKKTFETSDFKQFGNNYDYNDVKDELDDIFLKPIFDREDEFIAIGYLAIYGFNKWKIGLPYAARKKFIDLLMHDDILFGEDYLDKIKERS